MPDRAHAAPSSRRHAAGEDPAKRAAILSGAAQVFLDSGFDAASVNDICRAAGVSKSTLYVYFSGKEDLFEALVEQERDRLFAELEGRLNGSGPLATRLQNFACALAAILCSDEVIRAQRTVIGMAERMPDLGARFYDVGAQRTQHALGAFLQSETVAGRLAVPDIALAAAQFVELVAAGLWRQRLFGKLPAPPQVAHRDAVARAGVDMFLKAYGTDASATTLTRAP